MRKLSKQVEKVNDKVQQIKKDNSSLRLKNSELKDAAIKANADKNSAIMQLVRILILRINRNFYLDLINNFIAKIKPNTRKTSEIRRGMWNIKIYNI